jgi:rhodanese-related sulfurtransferase
LEKLKASSRFQKDSKLYFLCCCGNRSVRASNLFREKGYNAFNILYGFDGPVNDQQQRGKAEGWKFRNLPWFQN